MDNRTAPLLALAALLLAFAVPADAAVRSDPSRQSDASLVASIEVPVAMTEALSAGAEVSVTAIEASGTAVLLTVSAAGSAASAVIELSADAVRALGISVGTTVVVVAVATGWILSVAGESIHFVADALTRPHLHSHRLSP